MEAETTLGLVELIISERHLILIYIKRVKFGLQGFYILCVLLLLEEHFVNVCEAVIIMEA